MPHPALSIMAASLCLVSTVLAQGIPASSICRIAARDAERSAGIPGQLLSAIARVESGRQDPATGAFGPWPWAINVNGDGFFFNSKEEAIFAVRSHQARGIRSIDVGCMQVNLMHHPAAFPSLDRAFDPFANAAYAAHFLSELKSRTGDWIRAAALYHSQTPERGADYQRRVLAAWPMEIRLAPETTRVAAVQAWRLGSPGGVPPQGWNWTGGAMLSNRSRRARTLPMPGGGVARDLAAYRATPVAPASHRRMPRPPIARRF